MPSFATEPDSDIDPACCSSAPPAIARSIPFILLLGGLTAFGSLSIDMYLPAFPAIAKDLHVAAGSVEITLAAFLLSAGVGQALYGPISDRFGRRIPLMVGCALFILGAIWSSMARSIPELTAARLLQGFGSSGGMVIGRAVVRDLFNERDAAKMFSLLMLIMGAAPILAPWIGGELLSIVSWRGIFVFLAAFGVLILTTTAMILPETLTPERRSMGGAKKAMQNFGTLLTNKNFLGFALATGFTSGTLFSYISGSPTVMMKLHELSPRHFSILFGLNASGLIMASQINNLLLRKFQLRQILKSVVGTNALLGFILVAVGATGVGGLNALMLCLFFTLFSIGMTFPNLAAAAMAPHGKMAGSASALIGATQLLVGGFGGILIGILNNGTAIPMTALMAGSTVLSFLSLRFLALSGD